MSGDALSQNDDLRQVGKKVAFQRYFHESLISSLGEATRTAVAEACTIAEVLLGEHFNIIKLSDDGSGVSLLLSRRLMWVSLQAVEAVGPQANLRFGIRRSG